MRLCYREYGLSPDVDFVQAGIEILWASGRLFPKCLEDVIFHIHLAFTARRNKDTKFSSQGSGATAV